jgi:predicted dehydrogenase
MTCSGKDKVSQGGGMSRRQLLGSAVAAGAFTIVPSYVLGVNGQKPPSEKLNIATIGVGGMGGNNTRRCADAGENIVALCDVDEKLPGTVRVFNEYPNAKKYKDFRKMLEEQKDIDAVIVATPDHTHAVAAMMAIKMGKHVYVQKPMTHTVYEARKLTEAARQYKVATQMGNQGHSGEGIRLMCEWIWDGAIGPVREVHSWTNRPVWAQGIDRPKETPPVPEGFDWDLWLGPAPERPYNPAYHPFAWRAWVDFGCGALGDMACHILDPAFWALKLKYPVSVQASLSMRMSGQGWEKVGVRETYPQASIVRYKFPAREGMPEVKVMWYDGGMMPERPEELEEGRQMGDEDGGVLFIGDKGKLMCGCYGSNPRLIPETKMEDYKRPAKTLPRIKEGVDGHEKSWIEACKGGPAASSNFDYSGPFTETVVMGNLAMLNPYKVLQWDGVNMRFTNDETANEFVNPPYRPGWTL